MNTKTCESCEHYDPVLRGTRTTGLGWCAVQSLYPYKDSPGQVTPAGAKRVARPEDPAQPKLVSAGEVVSNCTQHQPRRTKLTKAELLAQAAGKKA